VPSDKPNGAGCEMDSGEEISSGFVGAFGDARNCLSLAKTLKIHPENLIIQNYIGKSMKHNAQVRNGDPRLAKVNDSHAEYGQPVR
jgi:hypothetical protein